MFQRWFVWCLLELDLLELGRLLRSVVDCVVGDYYSGLASTDSTLSYGGVNFRSQVSGVLRDPVGLTRVAQLGVGL